MNEVEILKRRIERERQARLQAETIMEKKASELFEANESLIRLNETLEHEIKERTLQLRESEEKYRGIIENMELGLLEVDNEDTIVRAYDRFCQMVGYTAEELIGRKAAEIFLDEELVPLILDQNELRKEGKTGVYEIPMRIKDGSIRWVLISGAPIHNLKGEVVGSIGIHYDISEKKQLIEDLASAKRIAEESQLAEKQFLANMSHEIRTPLNAIIGMAHLLYDTQPTPEQREYLDVLRNSSNFLHALISDILDMSKIEAGQVELVPKEIDLVGMIRTHQKAFEIKTEGRPIEVEALVDARLEGFYIGDELLLNQVLNNLLSNAEKFTQKGAIGIRVKKLQKTGDDVLLQFQVFDTGIGISENEINLIFQKFKQVNLQDRHKTQGTGLGLAIVKQLVELMGGEISVKSIPDQGTTFTFTVPFKKARVGFQPVLTPVSPPPIAGNALEIQQMRLLVVEDNVMNRKYLGNLLDKWKTNYDFAFNGREAIPLIQRTKYDLILMDIQMPLMDGYETSLAIRNTANINQNTIIIALTASAMNNQKSRAFDVGMNDYLSKPFTPAQLLEKLTHYKSMAPSREAMVENLSSENALNQVHLEEMYGDDREYASEMFGLFLHEIVPEINTLPELLSDSITLRKTIHKLKPTFGMVGLTDLSAQLQQLETVCDQHPSLEAITEKLNIFMADFQKYLPWVLQHYQKLTEP
ncbi:MAG: ATP-binding protein [Spirosomataceae bacterium]